MFCSKCGKEIDNEAVICVHCGCATQNYRDGKQSKEQPIIINNNNSASSSAVVSGGRVRRKRSLIFDIFMICMTGGLWIFWMIFRPKYY